MLQKEKITIALLLIFTMFCTNINAQHKKKHYKKKAKISTTKSSKKNWFVNQEFTTNRPAPTNPMEGGPDYLKINKNNTGEINQGDIRLLLDWVVKGSNLIFTSKQTSRIIKYKIYNNYLLDEYNERWFVKNEENNTSTSKGLPLTNTQWIIEHFNSPKINTEKKDCNININKNEKTFSGSDGCNRINGLVEINGQNIRFKNIASTKMLCENMKQSNAFNSNLNAVNNYKIIGGELFLYSDDKLIMTLESFR